MPTLTAVDYDPFADSPAPTPGVKRVYIGPGTESPKLTPVDYDPFANTAGDVALDVAKSAGVGIGRGLIGIGGLIGDASQGLATATNYLGNKAAEAMGFPAYDMPARDNTVSKYIPTSHDIQQYIEGVTGKFYKPQTRAGEYAQTVGEFLPGAALGPGGAARNAVNFAVVPGIASELAGGATKGTALEIPARVGTALMTGGVAAAINRPSSVGRAVRANLSANVDEAAVQQAAALMDDAAAHGVTLTWAEALEQVSPGAGLTNLQRVVESNRGGREVLAPILAQRPQQIENAARAEFQNIAPANNAPSNIGPAVGRAAEGHIDDTRGMINTASEPYYTQAAGVRLSPQEMARVRALPGYEEARNAVFSDPQLARYVRGMPEDSVGFLNEVKKQLDQSATNAASPVTAQQNMQRSAGYGLDATAVRDAARRASPDYDTALAIQSGGREQILQPIIDGPIGRLAKRDLPTREAINALFPSQPLANSEREIARTVTTLVNRNPGAARDLVRAHVEGVFNESARSLQSGPNQFGGAKFANRLVGNSQQRANLQAAVESLGPNGPRVWDGFDRLLDIVQATGTRQAQGSKTAFNVQDLKDLSSGGTVGNAIKTSASPAKWLSTISDAWSRWQLGNNLTGIAEFLIDPRSRTMLAHISRMPIDSTAGQILAARIIATGSSAVNKRRLEQEKSKR
ncbi:hypothetical protein [Bradyrhizobium sp. G127]|uniref:hypothetical protein n=1 Tax=Bradyrhizobium sp. G127 TaxID=2904800 RepID=UPI001F1DF6D8|nr:hypothetical protein [Bradyrhizobium sp. G127]MCF2523912.1 hypothetical protein [Bradyrhizobium sp. G127]